MNQFGKNLRNCLNALVRDRATEEGFYSHAELKKETDEMSLKEATTMYEALSRAKFCLGEHLLKRCSHNDTTGIGQITQVCNSCNARRDLEGYEPDSMFGGGGTWSRWRFL